MSILENIQILCKERNMSIPKLEKELSFGNGAIYKWEKSSPTIDKLQQVANYFNVSLDFIAYGFELTEFVQMANYVKEGRSLEQFSADTGIDLNELSKICLGFKFDQPSLETVEKIASSNPIDFIVSREDLLSAAGYKNGKAVWEKFDNTIDTQALKEEVKLYEYVDEILKQNENSANGAVEDTQKYREFLKGLKKIADEHSYDLKDPEFIDHLNKALAFVKSIRSDKKN